MAWATLLMAAPAITEAGITVVRAVKRHRKEKEQAEASRPRVSAASGVPRPRRVSSTLPTFTEHQRQSLAVIANEVKAYQGFSPELELSRDALTLGLWVNAWHESRLKPAAFNGKGEQSVGLFQINMNAHPGHTREQLAQADYNTRYMLELIQRDHRRFDKILRQGANIATLCAAITLWVERPKNPEEKAVQRAGTLRSWFPSLAGERAMGWQSGG